MKKTEIYLGEIQTQIGFAERAFQSYQQTMKESDVTSVFYHAHHFLIHASNIDKLIHPKNVNGYRGQYFAQLFANDNIDLKQFRKLRNHLEHFDERLDEWVEDFDGHTFFDMNIITAAKGFPTKAFLRAMDGHIFKFHGEEYDLLALHSEIQKISTLNGIFGMR